MYVSKLPNLSGAYPTPQSEYADGLLFISDELTAELLDYNGFAALTADGETVTKVTPNIEAWEAWKAEQPEPEPEPPTTDERLEKLEAENKLLKEQVSAQADQAEFYEDCIAEMAAVVYA